MKKPTLWVLALLAGTTLQACGGGGGGSAAGATPAATTAPRGTLLQDTMTAYPRLVRLARQADAARNGRILSSNTQNVDGVWQAGIHESRDDGASFTRIGAVQDPAFATGLCCGTLFELPQAVGALPQGTLLYSASVGADQSGAPMEHRIYRSNDGGVSWTRWAGASCGNGLKPRVPRTISGVWEPEFYIAGDGSLACVYSDETVDGHSQLLQLTRSRDGISFDTPRPVVQGNAESDRPGMPVVRRIGNGRWLMTYEWCSMAGLDCSVRYKTSADGLDWGPLGSTGTRVETASGQFLRHAPTHAWTARAGFPEGVVLLAGQILFRADGSVDGTGNGHVLLVNTAPDAAGPWRLVEAPIALPSPPAATNWCQHYSTPLLPSTDGLRVLMMQTDGGADASCRARFGSGAFQP